MELSPVQAHYLKKELITLQLQQELNCLKKTPKLDELFSKDDNSQFPFLRYLFQNFVVDFPLLKKEGNNAQSEFWIKCQTFLDEFRKVKLDTYTPKNKAASQRRVLMYKMEKMFIIALCASIKTTQDDQYNNSNNVTIRTEQQPFDEKDDLSKEAETKLTMYENEQNYLQWIGANQGLDINVIGVRDIVEKRTLREKVHAEFLVRVTYDQTTHVVAHRHGDFRKLHDDLQAAFPTIDIPPVPSKAHDASYESQQTKDDEKEQVLYREKDRILLRVFLHEIANHSRLAKSDIFETFLTSNTIELTEKEKLDVEQRLAMDQRRLDEETRFREQVDAQMDQLNDLLGMLKKQIVRPGGLLEIFDIIKKTDKIQDLPDSLRKAFEWGRINFAFVLHTQFLTSDRAVENTANLKRTHSLMPYRAIAQILKVSNPFVMVKGILDLFLAQPFGGRSLFQRIILVNMNDQAKELQKNIDALEKQINDPSLCTKIRNATETLLPDGEKLGVDTPIAETIALLQNQDILPQLTPEQIKKVALVNQNKESKQLVQQLYHLWKLYGRQREHEVMMTLMFQGVTGELIKDLFAIFYQPLAQVYRSANIGDSVNDMAAFLDDLIKLLDSLDVSNINNTAQPFVELVQRHEQKFYRFVHDVHANDTTHLFDDLLRYVDQVSSFAIHGLGQQEEKLDMASLVEASPLVTADQYTTLQQEIDQVHQYYQQRKELHLARQKAKLIQTMEGGYDRTTQDILEFLPSSGSGLAPLIQDMVELDMEEDSDDEDSVDENNVGDTPTSGLAHELLLTPPTLKVLPQLVPFFADQVAYMMRSL
ncbi:uncharacterized protein BX664DRAFT_300647 [Halteromyces radiatus]|uniref:uncharacterized protein n=1 Tax=Halteromyces radiatus TaxID=101107 RepID=UPI002220D346|nr:uncharacterized protein BX664DRAFT_300647 [Halteromyces radiatus]KAI8084991.1 hypothetical protein BX664DRAFT_300647 [Halteromyces radiatus]